MTSRDTVRLVLRMMLPGYRWVGWAAAGLPVVFGAAGAVTYRFGTIRHSVWEDASTPAAWFLFAAGVLTVPVLLPVFVAHGITRRTFAVAGGLLVAGASVLGAAYLAACYLAERAVFAAAGRSPELQGTHLFSDTGQVQLVLAESALLLAGYQLAGWLVGIGYYRLGGLRGTLALPLTLLPLIGVESALNAAAQWPWQVVDLLSLRDAAGVPVALGLGLAVVAVSLLAVRRLTGTIPIRPRS
jgi:hypothetical protein